jgi:glycine oxidase
MTDCIIIGGGLIGMLTARELAAGGAAVTVLDRGRTGGEASWAGGGILSPLYPWRYADPVSELAAWSQARYPELAGELAEESGIDPQWTRSGLLMLGVEDADLAQAWAGRWGATLEPLDGSAVAACEPALSGSLAEGLWMPDVAQVRNPRLVQALRGSLERRGVRLREGVDVTGLVVSHGRVQGVDTEGGRLAAGAVLMAAGAWSPALLAEAGIGLDVQPVRGQMILFRGSPGLLNRIVLDHGRYVIPRRDGRVLAGSTLEYVGFDKATTTAALDDLKAAAVGLVPALAQLPLERQWAGLRPGSPTGVPFIGAVDGIDGLYVNTGHFRNGVVLGPASARLAADLLLGRSPVVDPQPYKP